MDNRQKLIGMIKGNENDLFIYVEQPDGKFRYFDEALQKATGQSLNQLELRHHAFVVGSEETAMMVLELKDK